MRVRIKRTMGSMRCSLLIILAGMGIVGGLAVLQWPSLEERRSFGAVRIGMTEEEVLGAVGKPPGQYGPPGAAYAGLAISR
jgi:hypothetical protein